MCKTVTVINTECWRNVNFADFHLDFSLKTYKSRCFECFQKSRNYDRKKLLTSDVIDDAA